MQVKAHVELALNLLEKEPELMRYDTLDPSLFAAHGAKVSVMAKRIFVEHAGKQRLLQETFSQMHAYSRWIKNGLPAFSVTESLLAALTLTDPSNVRAGDVKPPFDTFVISVPYGFWALEAEGAYIEGFENDAPTGTQHVDTIFAHNYIGSRGPTLGLHVGTDGNIALNDRAYWPEDDEKIKAWLGFGLDTPDERYVLRAEELSASELAIQRAARRLYANLCLYIGEHGRGQPMHRPKQKARKGRRKNRAKIAAAVWLIGKEVKLSRELRDAARTADLPARRSGWKVAARFTVRGHWREQPCGPGGKERKRTWIAPYWKGPTDGIKVSHLYTEGARRSKE